MRNFLRKSTSIYRIGSLAKLYSNESAKYSGLTKDNFDRKLALFKQRHEHFYVSKNDRHNAFSPMLSGRALDNYFDSLQGRVATLKKMTLFVQDRFISAEHEGSLVREWEIDILQSVIARNPTRTGRKCLELLVRRLKNFNLHQKSLAWWTDILKLVIELY